MRATLLAVLLLALLAPTAHATTTVFATGLTGAAGIATGEDGSVYIAGQGGVTKLAPDGTKVATYPGPQASDVAVDSAGDVYVLEAFGAQGGQVRKIDSAGRTSWTSERFLSSQGLAVADRRVFLGYNARVEMLDAGSGAWLGSSAHLEAPGSGRIDDVTAFGDRVYAYKHGLLNVLDTSGEQLTTVTLGSTTRALIDIGRDGRFRALFPDVDRLDVYDQAFNALGQVAETAAGRLAEFGDWVYILNADLVLRIDKASLPGAPPVPTPTATPTPTPTPAPVTYGSVSINGGALYTNDPQVSLTVTAPTGAGSLLLANDGGFAPASPFSAFGVISWTLAESGAERLPKTVFVRALPGGETFKDDIILDQTAPTLRSASAKRSGKRYVLKVKASDSTSGVSGLKVAGRTLPYRATTKLALPKGKLSVRVSDRAGNWSKARRVK